MQTYKLTMAATKQISSDDVVFAPATPAQRELAWRINGMSWAGSLSIDDHVRRNDVLAATPHATSQTGGRTTWAMHRKDAPLDLVASVDAVGKQALVKDGSGLRTVRAYGVASVHTAPEYRKQGMAAHMLRGLQEKMDADGEFSVLYSDIGPEYYGALGWRAFPSLQVSAYLEGEKRAAPESVKFLSREEAERLCEKDVADLTERMGSLPDDGRTHVAFLPSAEQLGWQFERGVFSAKATRGREPDNHGAATVDGEGWVFWHHDLSRATLLVHRVVARSQEAVAELLRAAVAEAGEWGFEKVVAWNPVGVVEDGARLLAEEGEGVRVRFENRSDLRLPCLRWKGGAEEDVVWEDNYYYAWC